MINVADGSGDLKIVVLGGGTGSFTLLSALKKYISQITAIVNMVDDGGSSGVLRDELGVLPPGDVRQCLVALSNSPKLRDLFNYRFEEGTFEGHSFGNLFLTALEKTTGSFADAVTTAADILDIHGTVVPATLDSVRLKMTWPNASVTLEKEAVIDAARFEHDPREATLSLEPTPAVNPQAIQAIEAADLVVIAPGDLYTSLGPLLVIAGIGEALAQTSASVFYVTNLVTKYGQTDGQTVSDHVAEIERFAGGRGVIDTVLYNTTRPAAELSARYRKENAYMVQPDTAVLQAAHYRAVGGDFLGGTPEEATDTLPVTRGFIRHDSDKIVATIMGLYNQK